MFKVKYADGSSRNVKHEGTAVMLANREAGATWQPLFDEGMTRNQLRELAGQHEIPGRGKMTKVQLLEALRKV